MAKPIYPFQPFIEVSMKDNSAVFFDRIFIPEELISNKAVPADFFFSQLYMLTARLGYPIYKEELELAFGFLETISKRATTTISTSSDEIGLVTIDYKVIGLDNTYLSQDEDGFEADTGVTVSSYIPEMESLNNYRSSNPFLMSRITIMVFPDIDEMTDSRCDWLHYHLNNYMNRGYRLFIEQDSKTGANLMRYIRDCGYTRCRIYTTGDGFDRQELFEYQPIEACTWGIGEERTIKNAMEHFASHSLNPSSDTIKQTTALTAV